MASITTGDYINIEVPKNLSNLIWEVNLRTKFNILVFSFSYEYDEKKVIFVLKMENLDNSLQDFETQVKRKIKNISDAHMFAIRDFILDRIVPIILDDTTVITNNENKISEPTTHKDELKPLLNLSMEEFYLKAKEKYFQIKTVCDKNFPGIWHSIEFQLAVLKILNIKNCSLPFGSIILGAPSSSKTLGIELLRYYHGVYYTDSFSSKAFVSHNTNIAKDKLPEIDLLPKIKYKCLLAPELSPIFSKRDEDLLEILGILTRVLDGHGYSSDSGAHGQRGYSGDYMFTMIGAAVDIPHKVHRYLSNLGSKLYFYRIPRSNKKEEDYIQLLSSDDFNEKKEELKKRIDDYLTWFDSNCPLQPDVNSGLVKIEFIKNEESERLLQIVIRLGKLLAHLRGVVTTWNTDKTQGTNYGYSTPRIEEPDRAMTQLLNLAKGHAISQGRNYLTTEDIPILIKVALSTASLERVLIFDLLLAYRGKMTTSDISNSLKISRTTALKTMAELIALGLVSGDVVDDSDEDVEDNEYDAQSSNRFCHANKEKTIELEKQFDWFLSDEFQRLREGFKPEGKSKYETQREIKVKKDDPLNEPKEPGTGTLKSIEDESSENNNDSIKKKYPHTDNYSSSFVKSTAINEMEGLQNNKATSSQLIQENFNESSIDLIRRSFTREFDNLVIDSLKKFGISDGYVGISHLKLVNALINNLEKRINYETKIEIINKVIEEKLKEGLMKINKSCPIEYLVSESVVDKIN